VAQVELRSGNSALGSRFLLMIVQFRVQIVVFIFSFNGKKMIVASGFGQSQVVTKSL